MKSILAGGAAVIVLFVVTSTWAQSLTPIQGWVPFDSPKGKALMHNDPTTPAYQAALKSRGIDR